MEKGVRYMEEQNVVTDESFDYSDRIISGEEAQTVHDIQKEFLASYVKSRGTLAVEEWLPLELQKHLPEKSKEEIAKISEEIIESVRTTEAKKVELEKSTAAGRDKNSWLASELTQYTSAMSAQEASKYLQGLDSAVKNANDAMFDTITTKAGVPSMNMNLDGFIAEQHHVNSFNMKAQATGSEFRAEVLKPKPGETYTKNGFDVVIKDASGNRVHQYQMKYGATAEDTIRMLRDGNYGNQILVVPEEQIEAVQKAFPNKTVTSTISEGGVSSKPLTKEEAKKLQEEAQRGNFLEADWSEYAAKDLAKGIAGEVGKSCLMGAAVGAGMNVLSKVVQGEPIDGEEVIETAIASGADFGVKTAVAGGLKVAAEKEIISVIPKGTPAGTLANIAFVAVENVKILGKVATGELIIKEGVDKMQQTTAACVAGLAASTKGAALGVAVGSVLGPIGSAVGGFVGGCVGYMAGSKVGETVVKGFQKVRDTAKSFVKSTVSKVGSAVGGFVRGVAGLFGF